MKLTPAELAQVRAHGLYITEKCDHCRKLLNQTVRYTITGRPEVYCSAVCRDSVFFDDRYTAKKWSSPGKCALCGGSLYGKKRGSMFCDDSCRKRFSRKNAAISTAECQKSRTPLQLNQRVVDVKMAG
jgi:hypothetical protein